MEQNKMYVVVQAVPELMFTEGLCVRCYFLTIAEVSGHLKVLV